MVRNQIISAFLDAFYLNNTNDAERNVIDIHEWMNCNFSDSKKFFLVTLNVELGLFNK
jgi:hypothetical protein